MAEFSDTQAEFDALVEDFQPKIDDYHERLEVIRTTVYDVYGKPQSGKFRALGRTERAMCFEKLYEAHQKNELILVEMSYTLEFIDRLEQEASYG